jgi:hypothetical protein
MSDDRSRRTGVPDAETAESKVKGTEPFEKSRSGGDYDPDSNWAAERRTDAVKGGSVRGAEGAPSGAGDGGYGPEGDYAGKQGDPNADVLGQVRGSTERLVDQSRKAVEQGRTPQRTEPDRDDRSGR